MFRTRPDRPWGPYRLPYNGHRVSFSGFRRTGCSVDHPPPSSAEVKERVEEKEKVEREEKLYSPSGPSLAVPG